MTSVLFTLFKIPSPLIAFAIQAPTGFANASNHDWLNISR